MDLGYRRDYDQELALSMIRVESEPSWLLDLVIAKEDCSDSTIRRRSRFTQRAVLPPSFPSCIEYPVADAVCEAGVNQDE